MYVNTSGATHAALASQAATRANTRPGSSSTGLYEEELMSESNTHFYEKKKHQDDVMENSSE